MTLWDLVPRAVTTISVIGMAKNAGKTVALNRLLIESQENNTLVALTSIGRDGELEDVVTGTDKPGIEVVPGMIVATTDVCMSRSDARMEILETTGERSSMGNVLILRVRQRGKVEIAGPDTSRGIHHVCLRMMALGADKVLVDGALDRKSSASPAVTEATILSTGAVVDRDLDRVVKETAHQVKLLELPRWEHPLQKATLGDTLDHLLQEGSGVGIIRKNGNIECLPLATALNGGREIGRAMEKGDAGLLIRGSLTEKTVKDLMSVTDLYRDTPVIVEDATRIFVGEREWRIFRKKGLRVKVFQKNQLLFVTANPWSPGGWRFDETLFMKALNHEIKSVPVVNVMGKEASM